MAGGLKKTGSSEMRRITGNRCVCVCLCCWKTSEIRVIGLALNLSPKKTSCFALSRWFESRCLLICCLLLLYRNLCHSLANELEDQATSVGGHVDENAQLDN